MINSINTECESNDILVRSELFSEFIFPMCVIYEPSLPVRMLAFMVCNAHCSERSECYTFKRAWPLGSGDGCGQYRVNVCTCLL